LKVKGIWIEAQNMTLTPRNLSNFFPNLETINYRTSGLAELKPEDFSGLIHLKALLFNGNKLQEIEANLFGDTPKIHSISYSVNPIRHVAHGVFDNLKELSSLHVNSPINCINSYVDSKADVDYFIFRLFVSCPPSFEMTEQRIFNGIKFERKIDEQISERINPLTLLIYQMDQRLQEVDARVGQLESELKNLALLRQLLVNEKLKTK
jgi:BspA type Leucine rich repeat region (6 copies)